MLASDLKQFGARAQFAEIAQFYKLVCDGLILTRHIFEGLERPLYCDGSPKGDSNKLVYTRKPARDVEWTGGKSGNLIWREAPKGCVFVVIITPNTRHRDRYPSIDGWVNHWAWTEEDVGLAEAPINWVDRYTTKLWTREAQ